MEKFQLNERRHLHNSTRLLASSVPRSESSGTKARKGNNVYYVVKVSDRIGKIFKERKSIKVESTSILIVNYTI